MPSGSSFNERPDLGNTHSWAAGCQFEQGAEMEVGNMHIVQYPSYFSLSCVFLVAPGNQGRFAVKRCLLKSLLGAQFQFCISLLLKFKLSGDFK